MDGDFKADFSRDSFGMLHDFALEHDFSYLLLQNSSLLDNFSRLLWQQGRVILDADLNEQNDILLHSLRYMARDIIGPQGGPVYYDEASKTTYTGFTFYFDAKQKGYYIWPGHYYVDGILLRKEGENNIAYKEQPYYQPTDSLDPNTNGYLIYLDVWERQVTSLENDLIRETALGEGGPDTATRAQLVWQVKAINFDALTADDQATFTAPIATLGDGTDTERCKASNTWKQILEEYLQSRYYRGQLAAKAKVAAEEDSDNACIIPPEASYRGPENQLYRVEIHSPGFAWQDIASKRSKNESGAQLATFVVSRENGSVLFPILSIQSGDNNTVSITLDNLGRDDSRFVLNKNDWVEIVDENTVLSGLPGPICQVNAPPDTLTMMVTLTSTPASVGVLGSIIASGRKLLLRRWNYQGFSKVKNVPPGTLELANDGAIKVKEDVWLQLENGVQIWFQSSPTEGKAEQYRTGDYWLIPARTSTGNIIWPHSQQVQKTNPRGDAALLPPHGVRHHYAPLALLRFDENKKGLVTSLQCTFKSLVELTQQP